jgi:hypothetical protein
MIEHRIVTRDDRALQVLEGGDRNGRAVLVHNGTPNSRLLFGPDLARAQRRGIRLIS